MSEFARPVKRSFPSPPKSVVVFPLLFGPTASKILPDERITPEFTSSPSPVKVKLPYCRLFPVIETLVAVIFSPARIFAKS